jgi:hypothetical protein
MLKGIAHVHFREGERGPQEATLDFEVAMRLLEKQEIEEIVATFHLRHPTDPRPATPQHLLDLIREYNEPINIHLMPEANLVFESNSATSGSRISTDIETWHDLNVQPTEFTSLLAGWIVSAHFTAKLGWSKSRDSEDAYEQTYEFMLPIYHQVMQQNWPGWLGHPFQWCAGYEIDKAIEGLLATAVETKRVIEIPIKPIRRYAKLTVQEVRTSVPLFRPDIIAKFATYSIQTGKPLVAISLDAHHLADLEFGIENAAQVAEWLIAEGVHPTQVWAWKT